MSADIREDLLARLFALMGTVPGIVTAVRNRGLLKNENRPGMVLLDGDEFPRTSMDTRRLRGRAGLMAPQIVQLRPECYILMDENRPRNDQLGQELNAFRVAFLEKVWEDETLATILGSNGSLVYNGCTTDLKSGSALSGQMRVDFIANYVLRPTT
jgi:hypothetical protein